MYTLFLSYKKWSNSSAHIVN